MTSSFVSNGKQLPASAPLTDAHLAAFQWSLLQQSQKQSLHLSSPDTMMHSSYSSNLGPDDRYAQESGDDHESWPMTSQMYPTESLHIQVNGSAHQHPQLFLPLYQEQWNNYAPNEPTQSSSNHMMMNNYSSSGGNSLSPFTMQTPSGFPQLSPTNSDPSLSPLYGTSRLSSTPTTPASSQSFMSSPTFMPSPTLMPSPTPSQEEQQDSQVSDTNRPGYTHRQQLQLFREALSLDLEGAGPFIPQLMYKPHTTSDRKRYVEDVRLEPPIYFYVENHSGQCGISLYDALHSRVKNLVNREKVVFEGRGPSVSIRLEWPGYRQWSRQIPTKDFRSPPGPITIAKLAKNVAKCVQRFMLDRKMLPMEDGADENWRIGDRVSDIKVEDLMLVSIHHVSLGSWQPHLRLRRPQSNIRMRPSPPTEFSTSNIPIRRSPVEFSTSNIPIRPSPVEFSTSNIIRPSPVGFSTSNIPIRHSPVEFPTANNALYPF